MGTHCLEQVGKVDHFVYTKSNCVLHSLFATKHSHYVLCSPTETVKKNPLATLAAKPRLGNS